AFNWSIVPGTVVIHIGRAHDCEALPGEIWLDSDLLHSGQFAWGVVQHEYAHQVDFQVLTDANRSVLAPAVGGTSWWGTGLAHGSMAGERFASSIAWAYWPNAANALKPSNAKDEAGSIPAADFRGLLPPMPGVPAPLANQPVA